MSERRKIQAWDVQAGDVLVAGDQFNPSRRRIRSVSITGELVILSFHDGTCAYRRREEMVCVERPLRRRPMFELLAAIGGHA